MRAIQMTAPGGPEVLRLVELPEPQISGEHDVKVRLDRVADAHRALETGQVIGKAVLSIDG